MTGQLEVSASLGVKPRGSRLDNLHTESILGCISANRRLTRHAAYRPRSVSPGLWKRSACISQSESTLSCRYPCRMARTLLFIVTSGTTIFFDVSVAVLFQLIDEVDFSSASDVDN